LRKYGFSSSPFGRISTKPLVATRLEELDGGLVGLGAKLRNASRTLRRISGIDCCRPGNVRQRRRNRSDPGKAIFGDLPLVVRTTGSTAAPRALQQTYVGAVNAFSGLHT